MFFSRWPCSWSRNQHHLATLIYKSNRKTILKHYVTRALTLRYPLYTCTCQYSERSLGWLCFRLHKFLKNYRQVRSPSLASQMTESSPARFDLKVGCDRSHSKNQTRWSQARLSFFKNLCINKHSQPNDPSKFKRYKCREVTLVSGP